ncbi:MAG: terminase family protein [Hyphomicrobiaceae bacterium]|nr:terminase family protein [Hyphomicrobiaceae bacterium]
MTPRRTGSASRLRNAFSGLASAASRYDVAAALAGLPPGHLRFLEWDWQTWARDDQLPPECDAHGRHWRTWLILGGRGSGKTRAGAEWVRSQAESLARSGAAGSGRIALVGETLDQVRSVMVEGVSGLLAVHPPGGRPRFELSKRQIAWSSGVVAQLFSAEDPESLRGPQFAAAWLDEIAKWRRAEETWDMLQFGLRLGTMPQQVVTTTPRPAAILKRIMGEESTVVTRVRTADNAANLAPAFLSQMQRRYAGTLLGRQELEGELIDDVPGALWRVEWIEQHRAAGSPPLQRVVVAVDPPVTATKSSDACGICVAGLGADRRAYVLADRTLQGREPHVWARAAITAYRDFAADRIVAEVNQGGDLVESVLRQIDPAVPIRMVRATRGKWLRAEPVAALYAEGRVAHVGRHAALEAQMLAFGADGLVAGRSPDRLDALVWALTELILDAPPRPAVRTL